MPATTTTESHSDWLPLLLQFADAVFPAGGYAHSFGLEEWVRAGFVNDESTLLECLRSHFLPALGHVDLPLVREAHTAARRDDLEELLRIDALAGALKPAREIREASLRTGRRRLATLIATRPTPLLTALNVACANSDRAGHHAIVWGTSCAAAPADATLLSCLYQSMAGLCMAAPKLIRIGQDAAQRALTGCLAEAAGVVGRALRIPRDEIGWFDPALDLASMRHEIADERLFIS